MHLFRDLIFSEVLLSLWVIHCRSSLCFDNILYKIWHDVLKMWVMLVFLWWHYCNAVSLNQCWFCLFLLFLMSFLWSTVRTRCVYLCIIYYRDAPVLHRNYALMSLRNAWLFLIIWSVRTAVKLLWSLTLWWIVCRSLLWRISQAYAERLKDTGWM